MIESLFVIWWYGFFRFSVRHHGIIFNEISVLQNNKKIDKKQCMNIRKQKHVWSPKLVCIHIQSSSSSTPVWALKKQKKENSSSLFWTMQDQRRKNIISSLSSYTPVQAKFVSEQPYKCFLSHINRIANLAIYYIRRLPSQDYSLLDGFS